MTHHVYTKHILAELTKTDRPCLGGQGEYYYDITGKTVVVEAVNSIDECIKQAKEAFGDYEGFEVYPSLSLNHETTVYR